MTKEELAAKLNGRQYGKEITPEEEAAAKDANMLVIFGASDDLMEFRGVITDELGAPCEALIDDGRLLAALEPEDEDVLEKHHALSEVKNRRNHALKVTAEWCKGDDYSWTFRTEEEHASFDILDDGEKYCRGIVIQLP